MKRFFCISILSIGIPALVFAQNSDSHPILWKPAPIVEIHGQPADELNANQLREFLQNKIRNIDHSEGIVELIRIAPGYAITIAFDEPLEAIVIGDPSLVTYKQHDRLLVLSAMQRQGDTSLQLIFQGSLILNYHLFIAPNYVDADSTLHIHVERKKERSHRSKQNRSFRTIANTIRNFDLWQQEGALPDPKIERIPIMKKDESFIYGDFYRFSDGGTALSFSYQNQSNERQELQPHRLRVLLGNSSYKPQITSIHQSTLSPKQSTSGFIYFENPPFSLQQPFTLQWK